MAFKASVTTELVEYEGCGVPAVWEGVPGKPGDTKAEEVLQPRLRKPGEGEAEGSRLGWIMKKLS